MKKKSFFKDFWALRGKFDYFFSFYRKNLVDHSNEASWIALYNTKVELDIIDNLRSVCSMFLADITGRLVKNRQKPAYRRHVPSRCRIFIKLPGNILCTNISIVYKFEEISGV